MATMTSVAAASTRAKYSNHLKNHIRPAFGALMLCDIEPLLVQRWLDALKDSNMDGNYKEYAMEIDWVRHEH